MHRTLPRLAFLLLSCLATIPSSLAADPAPCAAPARAVRFLNYNVWGLPGPLLHKPKRLPLIARALPSAGADVIGLQEAFHSRAKALLRQEAYPYVARGPRAKFPKPFNSGLAILSRWPIVATASTAYHDCSSTDCLSRKGVMFARIRVAGVGDVDVFNTHLNAFDTPEIRVEQMRELLDFLRVHHDPRLPLVAVGDFNMADTEEAYRLFADETEARDTHLEFVAFNPNLSAPEREGLTSDPLRNPNVPKGSPRSRIDYAFVHEAPSRARIEVLDSRMAFESPVDGVFLSDHFALRTDLCFTPEP